jgi:mannose-6-phosphate isomerase class I
MTKQVRNTKQYLLPAKKPNLQQGKYDIYPAFRLDDGLICCGFDSLAEEMMKHKTVILDGYAGVFFEEIRQMIQSVFTGKGISARWINVDFALKSEKQIEDLIAPFTGGEDPVFGMCTTLELADMFDAHKLEDIELDTTCDINIIYGTGACLTGFNGFVIYFDMPKNELQFRARAGSVFNIGASIPLDIKSMYKRFYFVDWIVLNKLKQKILPEIDIIADTQRPGEVNWAFGQDIRKGLFEMSRSCFRVRPWFEPGVWGGTWIKSNIEGLNSDVPNYAWSFEMIVPENGIIFESSRLLLEISFDCLMYQEARAILGDAWKAYGVEFPIRFDFLDTFDGGNLSVQCHPQLEYMKKHFSENITQEECYYMLDCKPGSVVYLGFNEDIDPQAFKRALDHSFTHAESLDIEKYVRKMSASKHDFFLIPPGTIHGSGMDNLVLEISATPYIYTFKMYDWLRPDLDGKPRPLNIERGMENLCFERKGSYVDEKLVSKPHLLESDESYQIYHLPTHPDHLYDVKRLHLTGKVKMETDNKVLVMNLVEGTYIILESANGCRQTFSFAETFVVPAAAGSFTIINETGLEALVVMAFIK